MHDTEAQKYLEEHIHWPAPGRYVLAVSGGADSVALLDVFNRYKNNYGLDLVVAHFDHMMRPESAQDAAFVELLAKERGLPFFTAQASTLLRSEAEARSARYDFLHTVLRECDGVSIITAHHRDDVIETSMLNLVRGTSWRGLAPFINSNVLRPLHAITRQELRNYLAANNISWREDATNLDTSNPRNYIRHTLLPQAPSGWMGDYEALVDDIGAGGIELDSIHQDEWLQTENGLRITRVYVAQISFEQLQSTIAYAARAINPDIQLGARLVSELALYAKTGQVHTWRPVADNLKLRISKEYIDIL